MDKLKLWLAMTGVVAVGVLAGGWFLLVAPRRASAADTRVQAAAQEQANTMLTTQLSVLKAQAKGLPAQQAKLAEVAAKLPSDPKVPALIRSLTDAAAAAGVDLVSITPGALAPVSTGTAAAGGAASTSTADTTSTAATTSTTTTSTTTSSTTTSSTTTSSAATGGVGTLLAMPVSLNVAGGYYQLEQYLAALEDLPRALRVTGLTVTPGADPLAAPSAPAPGGSATPSAASPALTDGSHLLATITASVYVDSASGSALVPTVPSATSTTK